MGSCAMQGLITQQKGLVCKTSPSDSLVQSLASNTDASGDEEGYSACVEMHVHFLSSL